MRAILMTASTTVVGLLPLALGKSGVGGWSYYYPLARTVMGGLICSTFLTLIVLPYVNLGVEGAATWVKRLWAVSTRTVGGVAPAAAGPAEASGTQPAAP
jgi:HAE1 family hydrophobic/amphiphilic exporter-1